MTTTKISESTCLSLKKIIEKEWKNFVFRRVEYACGKDFIRGCCYGFDVSQNEVRFTEVSNESKLPTCPIIRAKEWTREYKSFKGVVKRAGRRGIRATDKFPGTALAFSSRDYSEIDVTKKCTFKFNPRRNCNILPEKGDLICGLVDWGKSKFTRWFICSEQFLPMWTLIMYKNHVSFGKKDEDRLRSYFMSGNKLCTNSFLKRMMALKDNRLPISQDEADKRYYHLRTEYTSRQWVHLYCALVLIVRWGKIPDVNNIPCNKNTDINIRHWNIPSHFITTLLGLAKCKPSDLNCETWAQLEKQARKRSVIKFIEPKVENFGGVVYTILKKDFPTLGESDKKPKAEKTESLDIHEKMDSGDSWADIMDAEEAKEEAKKLEVKEDHIARIFPKIASWADITNTEADKEIQDITSGSATPSEGGDQVFVVFSEEKSGYPKMIEILKSKEKAMKYLEDWVALQINDGHIGDGKPQKHEKYLEECELCDLRKRKSKRDGILWNGTRVYVETKEVM